MSSPIVTMQHDLAQNEISKFLWAFAALTLLTWLMGIIVPRSAFHLTFGLLAALWAALGVGIALFLCRSGHARWLWIPAALMVVLGVGISLPVGTVTYLLLPFNSTLDYLHDRYPDCYLFKHSAGKVAHTVCFAGLSLVTLLYRRQLHLSYFQWLVGFVLLALATEGMQLFIGGRSTKLEDIGFDASGVGIGIVAFAAILLVRSLLRKTTSRVEPDGDPGVE